MPEIPEGFERIHEGKTEKEDQYFDYMSKKFKEIEEEDIGMDIRESFSFLIRKIK